MEKSKPCTCGGANKKCYRCSGTGVIYPTIQAPPYRVAKRKSRAVDLLPLVRKYGSESDRKAAEARTLAYMITCDRCRYRGLPEEVRQHKTIAHPEKPEITTRLDAAHVAIWHVREEQKAPHSKAVSREQRTRKSRKLARFYSDQQPRGDEKLRGQAIASGLIKPAISKAAPAKAASEDKIKRRSICCPLCRATMKRINLEKPLARVHHSTGKGQQKPKVGTLEEDHAESYARFPELLDHFNDLQIVDEREAHRQMGFVIKENGRYGSHPLHDRFDDESEP